MELEGTVTSMGEMSMSYRLQLGGGGAEGGTAPVHTTIIRLISESLAEWLAEALR